MGAIAPKDYIAAWFVRKLENRVQTEKCLSSTKLFKFIKKRTQISAPNIMAISSVVIETFYSKPNVNHIVLQENSGDHQSA